jgi:protein-S-isoprenylcysteine O-methyltransferase Ste14
MIHFHFNSETVATVSIVLLGALIASPVLIKGFTRRGTGVKYEQNFLIQRAPQFATLFNIFLLVVAYIGYNGYFDEYVNVAPYLSLVTGHPEGIAQAIAWLGLIILLSGMVFMIGGWYSLGEMFSTDAEVLDNHTVRSDGLLKFVMHPAYSGIIQCLLGAALAATSIPCALFTIFVVAPLWLGRAKYEENLLIESLGQSYREYAESMRWRRLIPRFFPIGV